MSTFLWTCLAIFIIWNIWGFIIYKKYLKITKEKQKLWEENPLTESMKLLFISILCGPFSVFLFIGIVCIAIANWLDDQIKKTK